MINLQKHIINYKDPVKAALKKLNSLSTLDHHILYVLDKQNKIIGTITDKDIRNGLIQGKNIEEKTSAFMLKIFKTLKHGNNLLKEIKQLRKKNISLVPLVDNEERILKIIDLEKQISILPIDAIIMAGGLGERLRPLTNNTPKPMLKVGNKPILEHNIDRLIKFGIDNINISIMHFGEQIEAYFKDGGNKGIVINYLKEKQPLGTIGATTLLTKPVHNTFLVMNSDLLTNVNLEDFYQHFINEKAYMSVCVIPYKINIPYAVIESVNNTITTIKEKPTYTYYSNAGIYLLKKEVINLIPKNTFFNATDLIELLISKKKKVTKFPILSYWLDIGKHEDYNRAQEDIKHIIL